jgi:hypothetical protein
MGNYFSNPTVNNYKYDRLCNLMKLSPKSLNDMISEKTDIDIVDLRKYKWMGLNFLHLIEIFIGFLTCTSSRLEILKEWIELRKTVIQTIPELLKDSTEDIVYFSDGSSNSMIDKGSVECKFQIPFPINVKTYGVVGEQNSIMFTETLRSYNQFTYHVVNKLFTINKNLTRMEFLIQLQAVFKNFPVYKANKLIKKIVEESLEKQIEGLPNNSNPPAYSPNSNFIPGGLNL